jgi:pimeloyl-ACP methyl ester carboxylesterase
MALNESAIHITRWGRSGPKVVLVHGSAQGSQVGGDRHFSAQQRLADRGWQLVVPDRPGHGRSVPPGRPDDAELDGEWVAELLGEGAHLVGHSFGGCVALAAAAIRPEAVLSLTLIEPGMQRLAMDIPVVRRFGLRMMSVLMFSMSAQARAKRFAEMVRIPPEIRGGSDPDEFRRMGQAIARLKVPSREILQSELAVVKRAAIPLLVVTGGWSAAFDATADRVAAAGGGRHIVIESEHHFPQLNSDEFNEVLEGFMREAPPRGSA